jgi:hypothetical protein
MAKTCELKDPGVETMCGAEANWIADVGWIRDSGASAPSYKGTSWSVALCERHYDELLEAGRITGTARRA